MLGFEGAYYGWNGLGKVLEEGSEENERGDKRLRSSSKDKSP